MLFFNVLLQISFPVSCILAMGTFERFFVCMGVNMAGTMIWSVEFFAANWTSVGRRTKSDALQCKYLIWIKNFIKNFTVGLNDDMGLRNELA